MFSFSGRVLLKGGGEYHVFERMPHSSKALGLLLEHWAGPCLVYGHQKLVSAEVGCCYPPIMVLKLAASALPPLVTHQAMATYTLPFSSQWR